MFYWSVNQTVQEPLTQKIAADMVIMNCEPDITNPKFTVMNVYALGYITIVYQPQT